MKKLFPILLLLIGVTFSGCLAPKVKVEDISFEKSVQRSEKVPSPLVKKVIKIDTKILTEKPNANLENTYWKLLELNGIEVKTPSYTQREAHIVLSHEKVRGYSGCNRFSGHYTLEENTLSFSDKCFMTTRMFCRNSVEHEFLNALKLMKSYKISGEYLEIFDSNAIRLARFISIKS